MPDLTLSTAVENYCALFLDLPDQELARPWVWKDHDTEGLRFSFFVTYQELRQLAVKLAATQPPLTPARHILGQYHAAYLDLQAALLGLPTGAADQVPAPSEWPVRRTYAHLLSAEISFSAAVMYALEGHRAGAWKPEPMVDKDVERLIGLNEVTYAALLGSPLNKLRAFHRDFHTRILAEFSGIIAEELDLPSTFWEETRFPLRHRLHRFEAHLIQHTVQIDKILALLGRSPSEAQRLARKVYAALAEAEAALPGLSELPAECEALAQEITERTEEIRGILGS